MNQGSYGYRMALAVGGWRFIIALRTLWAAKDPDTFPYFHLLSLPLENGA
jgi:hypothetical protein